MAWIETIAMFVFAYWRAKRMAERRAELEPTGMFRSPLYFAQAGLLLMLLGLMFAPSYLRYLPHGRWTLIAYLAALVIVLAAMLLVGRVLKWRYGACWP